MISCATSSAVGRRSGRDQCAVQRELRDQITVVDRRLAFCGSGRGGNWRSARSVLAALAGTRRRAWCSAMPMRVSSRSGIALGEIDLAVERFERARDNPHSPQGAAQCAVSVGGIVWRAHLPELDERLAGRVDGVFRHRPAPDRPPPAGAASGPGARDRAYLRARWISSAASSALRAASILAGCWRAPIPAPRSVFARAGSFVLVQQSSACSYPGHRLIDGRLAADKPGRAGWAESGSSCPLIASSASA